MTPTTPAQEAPFAPGQWIAAKEGYCPYFGTVERCRFIESGINEWEVTITLYLCAGEPYGTQSVPARQFHRIKEPRFPLALDASRDWGTQLVREDAP